MVDDEKIMLLFVYLLMNTICCIYENLSYFELFKWYLVLYFLQLSCDNMKRQDKVCI